ncbi:MAG: trehalose-phosphatase [Anaerolineales bacterium]
MTATPWQEASDLLTLLAAKPRFGFVSDLDGTLAPIAPTPDAAHISARARQLLAALRAELPLVALVSGRRAESLAAKVDLPGIVYVGNHGLERWADGKTTVLPQALPYLPHLQAVRAELRALEEDGVFVEDKEATLSFHYRQAANPEAFAERKRAHIANLVKAHGLVLFEGKRVFEVRPPIEMDKGIAFQQLVAEHRLEAALFVGDDISDLNALAMARRLREESVCDAWGVGVQSPDAPPGLAGTADFLAAGVPDVEELLSRLLSARKASST